MVKWVMKKYEEDNENNISLDSLFNNVIRHNITKYTKYAK